MKVIHVMGRLEPSGAEMMLKLAAPIWREEGVELAVLAFDDDIGPFAAELERAGYKIQFFPRKRNILAIDTIRRAKMAFTTCRADVVHIHVEAQSLLFVIAARAAGATRIVRTVHNNFSYSGWLRHRKSLERRFARWLGTRHVSIGPSVEKTELQTFGNRTERVENWIDAAHFRPPSKEERASARAALGIGNSTHLLVTVGNASDTKNYRALIEALPAFADRDLLYLQVGGEHRAGTDRECVARLGLEDRVRFVGPVDNVRDYLWAADTYVMPSLREGNSLAAAEALSTGVPCVFTRVAGLRDWAGQPANVTWAESPRADDVRAALQVRLNGEGEPPSIQSDTSFIRQMTSARRGALEYLEIYRFP